MKWVRKYYVVISACTLVGYSELEGTCELSRTKLVRYSSELVGVDPWFKLYSSGSVYAWVERFMIWSDVKLYFEENGWHLTNIQSSLEQGDFQNALHVQFGTTEKDGYIYHLTGPSEVLFKCEGLQVKRELLLEIAGRWKASKDNTRDDTHKPLKPEQAIRVAKSYVGNLSKSYDLRKYNCETWACMIRYGEGISFQVPKYLRLSPMSVTVARKEQLRLDGSLMSATTLSQSEREFNAPGSTHAEGQGMYQAHHRWSQSLPSNFERSKSTPRSNTGMLLLLEEDFDASLRCSDA